MDEGEETNDILSPEEIVRIAPRKLIEHVIKGIMSESKLFLSVMFDKDEADPKFSSGTGKVFVTDDNARKSYCKYLRNNADREVRLLCPASDRATFEKVKQMIIENPKSKAFNYICAGGLKTIAVPIVERETGTFIGVILAGQKRPKESKAAMKSRLREHISRPGNEGLQRLPFRTLLRHFRELEQVTNDELHKDKERCEIIAKEIGERFSYFAQTKMADKHTRAISDSLIRASSLEEFWDSTEFILKEMQSWLKFDWGIAFRSEGQGTTAEWVAATGRGVRHHQQHEWQLALEEIPEDITILHNPGFLQDYVRGLFPEKPDFWLCPVIINGICIGGFVIGLAPGASRTKYDSPQISRSGTRLQEILTLMALEYSELRALEKERQRREELEKSEKQLEASIKTINDRLTSLTHQINRPLFLNRGVISLVRQRLEAGDVEGLKGVLEISELVTSQSALMVRGTAKILAAEGGGEFRMSPQDIDAKIELKNLCDVLNRFSGRDDLRFRFFEQSPKIIMDRDSFLYVFSQLIDNALKYADPGTTIALTCEKEFSASRYALKVKSTGAPIRFKDVENVFQKFWRGQHADRGDAAGLGIGCWAAREHMRRQDGELELDVNGRFSVFIVYPPSTF